MALAQEACSPKAIRLWKAELARRGVDAYHTAFAKYFFCAICNFEDGSLVILSEKLWASEVIRRIRPALEGQEIEIRLAS